MKCPACSAELSTMTVGTIDLDVCSHGCGGVWFDHNELFKFDEEHEFPTSKILQLANEKRGIKVDLNKKKMCPKCSNEALVRQFLDIKNQIEMDQCWNCSGVWLDVGEINSLRDQYKTYEDRAKAVNEYIDARLAETEKTLNENTAQQVRKYNEENQNHFMAALFALKQLLGLDDLNDSL